MLFGYLSINTIFDIGNGGGGVRNSVVSDGIDVHRHAILAQHLYRL